MAQALLKPAKLITYYKIFDFIFVMYATHKLPKAVYCKKKCNWQKPHNTLSVNNICTSHSLTHTHIQLNHNKTLISIVLNCPYLVFATYIKQQQIQFNGVTDRQ